MKKQLFLTFLSLYTLALFYLASTTPITPHEANIFYNAKDIVGFLMRFGDSFDIGVMGLRVFFIFFGFLSLGLFYLLSQNYFEKREDVYLSVVIFMLLPGTLVGMILGNIGIIVLPMVLLFILLYEKGYRWVLLPLMFLLFFLHESSLIFFMGVLLYSVKHKENQMALFSLSFLLAFLYLAKGIKMGGHPSGHFIEIFGSYASLFSPLLFLYFFYAMYRILLREKKTLLWYISFTALAFSLLLSLRQRVDMTDFAPYVMISIILMLNLFHQTLRVRLIVFQKWYKRGFWVVMGFLILSIMLTVGHRLSFEFENPKWHFAQEIYRPYFLAEALKKRGVNCYDSLERVEKYQLLYYNIPSCF